MPKKKCKRLRKDMENKRVVVKQSKVEDTIEFYSSFGWLEVGERKEVKGDKVAINFERDKDRLGDSYRTIIQAEHLYARIKRPYPLAFIILFSIASTLLILFFTLQEIFPYYIVFIYISLTCYCVSAYLLFIFIFITVRRRKLLAKVVKDVAIDAGTIREYPLKNNIKEETDKTWLISSNIE